MGKDLEKVVWGVTFKGNDKVESGLVGTIKAKIKEVHDKKEFKEKCLKEYNEYLALSENSELEKGKYKEEVFKEPNHTITTTTANTELGLIFKSKEYIDHNCRGEYAYGEYKDVENYKGIANISSTDKEPRYAFVSLKKEYDQTGFQGGTAVLCCTINGYIIENGKIIEIDNIDSKYNDNLERDENIESQLINNGHFSHAALNAINDMNSRIEDCELQQSEGETTAEVELKA